MNQVNLLPQELIKAVDYKADSSGAESSAQNRDVSFSSLVEQHSSGDQRGKNDGIPIKAARYPAIRRENIAKIKALILFKRGKKIRKKLQLVAKKTRLVS